jgi:hypothetical protein
MAVMKTSLLATVVLFLSLSTFSCAAPPPEPEGSSASHLSSPAQSVDPSPAPAESSNGSTNDDATNLDAYPGSDLDLEFAADETLVAGPAGAETVKAACHVGTKIVSGLVACYIACTGTGAVGPAAIPLGKGAADVVEVFKDCEERARKVSQRPDGCGQGAAEPSRVRLLPRLRKHVERVLELRGWSPRRDHRPRLERRDGKLGAVVVSSLRTTEGARRRLA